MEERDKQPVKVLDRRHFTKEGSRREPAEAPEDAYRPAPLPDPPPAAPPGPAGAGSQEGQGPADAGAPGEPSLFSEFVISLSSSAFISLGQMPNPASGVVEPDLASAASMIDVLEMLKVKTRGNLTPYEAGLLEKIVYELKILYVEAMGQRRP